MHPIRCMLFGLLCVAGMPLAWAEDANSVVTEQVVSESVLDARRRLDFDDAALTVTRKTYGR